MADWLFDRNGRPRIIEDEDCFRSADGRVIGWISGTGGYSLSGRLVAWYERRVLYDSSGLAIGFCADASGYLPTRPGLSGPPDMPSFAGRPARPGLSGVPNHPGFGGWSPIRLDRFFR